VSAHALVADLDAAGVHLTRVGDDLRFETQPGVTIAPYRERILASKPALLSILGGESASATSALIWHHVDQGPVEATVPPSGWDGGLCGGCRWPVLCAVLGPRGANLRGGPCPAYPAPIATSHMVNRDSPT
jgi:hypothetical protein